MGRTGTGERSGLLSRAKTVQHVLKKLLCQTQNLFSSNQKTLL